MNKNKHKHTEFMWITQLEEDPDIVAQIEALRGLKSFSNSHKAMTAALEALENK